MAINAISKVKYPEGCPDLVPAVCDAMRTFGFLIRVNYGVTELKVTLLNDSFHGSGNSLAVLVENHRVMIIADILLY